MHFGAFINKKISPHRQIKRPIPISTNLNTLKYAGTTFTASFIRYMSIAVKGVFLSESIIKLVTANKSHKKLTIPYTNIFLLNKSAIDIVNNIITVLYKKITGLVNIYTNPIKLLLLRHSIIILSKTEYTIV